MFIGLEFIENFIFLVKKFFLTKSQNLASERNFDVNKIHHPGDPFSCKTNLPEVIYIVKGNDIVFKVYAINKE